MSKPRICHEIVLDKRAGEVRLDGLVFPYHVREDVDIEGVGKDELASVVLSVFADNVTVVDWNGRTERPVVASHQTEIAWARAEGRRIARLGLADVDPEQIRERESAPIFDAIVEARS